MARRATRSWRQITTRGALARLISADDARDERMPHDILLGEMDDTDIVEPAQRFERVGETRACAGRQIDLARLAGPDHARSFRGPRQNHPPPYPRRVLRLRADGK